MRHATRAAGATVCLTPTSPPPPKNDPHMPEPMLVPEVFNYHSPTVPLPPMGMDPNRLNGTEKVTTLGVTSRMTMTSAGLAGISLEDMSRDDEDEEVEVEKGLSETWPVRTPSPIAAAGKRRKAVPRGPGRRYRCW